MDVHLHLALIKFVFDFCHVPRPPQEIDKQILLHFDRIINADVINLTMLWAKGRREEEEMLATYVFIN